jgi:hypothetical protein
MWHASPLQGTMFFAYSGSRPATYALLAWMILAAWIGPRDVSTVYPPDGLGEIESAGVCVCRFT